MLAEDRRVLSRYPDQDCSRLRRALADYTGVPAQRILCGNGASELIEAALRAVRPGRVLLTAPSFSGYRRAAENCGARILYHLLRPEEDFALTDRFLADLEQLGEQKRAQNCLAAKPPSDTDVVRESPGDKTETVTKPPGNHPDMVILCSPSNPVGNLIDPGLMEQIALTCARQGIWLMADECFLGFAGDEKERTMRRYLMEPRACIRPGAGSGFPGRLLVVDAFTKRFAMPGIRLGYLMAGDTELLREIRRQQPEWSVSGPAQTAGLAALEGAEAYMEKARELAAAERERMAEAMRQAGLRVFPGQACYIFFQREPERYAAMQREKAWNRKPDLSEALLKRGILIRDCSNYAGLEKGYYRAAVKKPEENEILLQALREILADSDPGD